MRIIKLFQHADVDVLTNEVNKWVAEQGSGIVLKNDSFEFSTVLGALGSRGRGEVVITTVLVKYWLS